MINDEKTTEEGSTEIPVTRPDFAEEEKDTSPPEARQPAMIPELPNLSEAEIEAVSKGWKPQEDFDVEEKDYVSADEFLRRGELFDKIRDLKHQGRRDTRRLEDQVKDLTDLVRDSRVQGYEQALTDLEAKRKDAVEVGDVDAFNSIDSQYNKVREAIAKHEAAPQAVAQDIDPAAIEFQDRNKDWFNNNTHENTSMVNQAINIDQHLAQAKPYLSEVQRLEVVEKEMKDLYPHRFANPKKAKPAAVETAQKAEVGQAASQGATKLKYSDLDQEQKDGCSRFLATDDALTVEDYLRSYEKVAKARDQRKR